jgi:hypothetical protein
VPMTRHNVGAAGSCSSGSGSAAFRRAGNFATRGETRNWALHALNVRTNHVCTAHDFMIGLGNNPKQRHLSSFRMADDSEVDGDKRV